MNMTMATSKFSSKLMMHFLVQSKSSSILANRNSREGEDYPIPPCNKRLKRQALSTSKNTTTKRQAKISKKWMDYQGINGWEGLLDPLDEILRSELLRYGYFVEAAYHSYDFNPSSPNYATCKYPRSSLLTSSGISASGYRVTRNLYATCGVEMPSWALVVPDWMSIRSSWIGYVAVCHDRREISRLGRRDVVIALRGTGTCLEWIENLRPTLTCVHGSIAQDGPMVQTGFLSVYTSKASTRGSLQDTIREEVGSIIRRYGENPLSFTITGHSLGAALATLTAHDIHATFTNAPMVTVISFGGPRVGNKRFGSDLEKSGTNILRIVNSDDLVTKVPGFRFEGIHDTVDYGLGLRIPSWLHQGRAQDSQWLYADFGRELRLSSKDCPYLGDINVATCHELKTYLQLVSSFVSSECSFRNAAKKVLHTHSNQS